MLINNCGQIQEWAGVWPAKKNSRRIVCVLAGSAHAGLDDAEYLGTHYSRISREEYDWYRLPAGTKIIRDGETSGKLRDINGNSDASRKTLVS